MNSVQKLEDIKKMIEDMEYSDFISKENLLISLHGIIYESSNYKNSNLKNSKYKWVNNRSVLTTDRWEGRTINDDNSYYVDVIENERLVSNIDLSSIINLPKDTHFHEDKLLECLYDMDYAWYSHNVEKILKGNVFKTAGIILKNKDRLNFTKSLVFNLDLRRVKNKESIYETSHIAISEEILNKIPRFGDEAKSKITISIVDKVAKLAYQTIDNTKIIKELLEVLKNIDVRKELIFPKKSKEENKEKSCKINILTVESGGYMGTAERDIWKKDYEIKDFDLFYGNGFTENYHMLKEKIKSSSKGMVIFQGEPGTGKTYLIRNLMCDIDDDKEVIYIPPSVISYLSSPEFTPFILSFCEEAKEKNKNVLLVIEDAEALVQNRTETSYNNSTIVSTILNITDGILNDFYNIQILVTFNAPEKHIDKAILREGRLMANFEFGPIYGENIQKICDYLNIENIYTKNKNGVTLSEIFSKSTISEAIYYKNENDSYKEYTL